MPRKAKIAKDTSTKPTSPENDPQPTLTEEPAEPGKASPKDRDTGGKFTKGNAGGPGNPHARSCARMLEMFRNAISEEELFRLVRKMFEKAEAGDMSAAKMIFSYKIGKPLPAPHPDSIDRDEWDHYQKDAMHEKEMALVINSLPTAVGNDIARVSLPIMTAARKNELGMQLMEGMEVDRDETQAEDSAAQAEENEQVEANAEAQPVESQPIPNGKKTGQSQRRTEKKATVPNGKNGKHTDKKASTRAVPATGINPAAKNKTRKQTKRKAKMEWLQPLAKQLEDSVC